jgi:small GTP-binding protein
MTVLKIALCGDGGVGKTAIRRRFLGEGFKTQYLLTIGADFAMRDDSIDGYPVRYQIWDLAGQERFDSVREVYYRGCIGGLLVYDITRHDSFFNTPKWINELWKNNGRGRIPIVVVANKIDLREVEDNTINREQGITFSNKLSSLTRPEGFECPYLETSAKTGENISEAFRLLGSNIVKFMNSKGKSPQVFGTQKAQNY